MFLPPAAQCMLPAEPRFSYNALRPQQDSRMLSTLAHEAACWRILF
jgi:hypothetical protein